MIQPVEVERRDASERGLVTKRHPRQRLAPVLATTDARREWTAARRDSPPSPILRRDVLDRPRQPRHVQRAAEIEELSSGGEAHRRERARQMRRRFDRSQPLHGARI